MVKAILNYQILLPESQMFAAVAGRSRQRATHIPGMVVAASLRTLLFMILGTWFLSVHVIDFVWMNCQSTQQIPACSAD